MLVRPVGEDDMWQCDLAVLVVTPRHQYQRVVDRKSRCLMATTSHPLRMLVMCVVFFCVNSVFGMCMIIGNVDCRVIHFIYDDFLDSCINNTAHKSVCVVMFTYETCM